MRPNFLIGHRKFPALSFRASKVITGSNGLDIILQLQAIANLNMRISISTRFVNSFPKQKHPTSERQTDRQTTVFLKGFGFSYLVQARNPNSKNIRRKYLRGKIDIVSN